MSNFGWPEVCNHGLKEIPMVSEGALNLTQFLYPKYPALSPNSLIHFTVA
jgi:hypothetical protein